MKHWCGFFVSCKPRSGHDAIAASVVVVAGFFVYHLVFSSTATGAVVISDSERFKHLVRWFYPRVIVSEATPVHSGLAANNELLLQTLQDFFLIANASNVKTFSEYVWASGFVVSACRVYDIPLTEIDRKSLRKTRRIKLVFNRIRDWF